MRIKVPSVWGHVAASAIVLTMSIAAAPAAAQSYTVLHAFESPLSEPRGNLIQGTDGNFYGTTSSGGTSGIGTVFKITPAGTLVFRSRYRRN